MSDNAHILVWTFGRQRTEHAAKMLAWLVERGVVLPMPTDCALGALAHPPGPEVFSAVEQPGRRQFDFRELQVNGLEIHLSHSPRLHGGTGMPTFRCPTCKSDVESDAVFEAMAKPHNPFLGDGPKIQCPGCKDSMPPHFLESEECAFGTLALQFWNWPPLKPTFIAELSKLCGATGTLVHEHI